MKRIVILVLAVFVLCGNLFAENEEPYARDEEIIQSDELPPVPALSEVPSPASESAVPVTLKGDIIDNMCAEANKDNVAEFVKAHTKECALMCASSGYTIVSDGKLYAFDEPGSKQVEEFLKNPESKLQVEVTALQIGDKLSILEIKNQ